MVVAVHPERLAREAAPAASTAEARDWMRPAERLVEAVADEPGRTLTRRDVVRAVAVRATRRRKHGRNSSWGLSAGPAQAGTPGDRAGCTVIPKLEGGKNTRMPDSATADPGRPAPRRSVRCAREEEHRDVAVAQNPFRDAAQHEALEAAAPVRRHGDQVAAPVARRRADRFFRRAAHEGVAVDGQALQVLGRELLQARGGGGALGLD